MSELNLHFRIAEISETILKRFRLLDDNVRQHLPEKDKIALDRAMATIQMVSYTALDSAEVQAPVVSDLRKQYQKLEDVLASARYQEVAVSRIYEILEAFYDIVCTYSYYYTVQGSKKKSVISFLG